MWLPVLTVHAQVTHGTSTETPEGVENDVGGDVGRRLRFKCNRERCQNTEVSLQRRLKKCDQCRAVRYCSLKCLAADWEAQHKSVCRRPSLTVDAEAASLSKLIRGNEPACVVGAEAGASTMVGVSQGPVCSLPGCAEHASKSCSRCRTARYCSAAHQKEHWREHKSVCCQPPAVERVDTGGLHVE